ncbi:uncharacterized protein LOC126808889 isoform X2 [Patella vulgata]|nr:uncharacterized protein LOC126808889 isoform X2 [Patella vulgata]
MNQHRVYTNEMDSARNFPPSPREMYSTMMYEDMRHSSNNRSLERIPPVLPPRSPDTRLSNSTGTSSRGSSISEPDLGQGLYQDSHYSTPSPPISPAKKHPHHPSSNQPYSYVPNASLLQQQKKHSEQDYTNGATDPHSFYYSPENTYASYIHNEDASQQYEQSPRHMQIRNSVKKLTNGVQTSPVLRRSSVGQSDTYNEQKSKCKNVGSPKLPKKFQQRSASVDCQMSVPPPPNFPAPPPPLQVKDRYLAGAQSTRCPSPPLPPPPPELHAGQAVNPPPPPPVSTIPGRQTRPAGREEAVKKSRSGSLSRSNSGVDAAIIQEIGTIKLKTRSQSTAGILNGSSSIPSSIQESSGSGGDGGNELGRIQLKKTKTDKLGDIYQTAEESLASSPPLFTPPFVPVCDIDDFPLPPPPEELLPVKPPAAAPVAKQTNNSGPRSPIVKQSTAIPAVPKSPTVKHTPFGSAPKSPVIKHVPLTPKSPISVAPPVSPKSPIVTQASPVSFPTPVSQVVSPSNGHSKSKDTTNAKMDFEIPADIDLSKCPGLVPTPAHCPVWKREMIDKKNKDRVEEYVREILQEREEQEKWKNVPEWKRKILKQKADEDRAKAKATKEGTAPPPPEQKTTQQELLHAGQGHREDNFVPAAMNIDPEEFESMPPWKQELLTKRKNIPVTFNNEFNPDEEEEPQPQRQEYNLDVKMAS